MTKTGGEKLRSPDLLHQPTALVIAWAADASAEPDQALRVIGQSPAAASKIVNLRAVGRSPAARAAGYSKRYAATAWT